MNIVITPHGKEDTRQVFKYIRLFKSVLQKIREKDPKSQRMFICLDDATCIHDYQFTGEMVGRKARIRCTKCGHISHVDQKPNNVAVTHMG